MQNYTAGRGLGDGEGRRRRYSAARIEGDEEDVGDDLQILRTCTQLIRKPPPGLAGAPVVPSWSHAAASLGGNFITSSLICINTRGRNWNL
jgi:hypothetical protein